MKHAASDLDARHWAFAGRSVALAASGALVAVAAALVHGYALRLERRPWLRGLGRLATVGYAVPGTVLAVGVLLPVGALDRTLAEAWRAWTGESPGLLLTGTVFALVYAYLVRYFAVAWNGIEPGFARITPAMDAAARSFQ